MATQDNDLLEQVDRHLSNPNQNWLLGAGISKDAGIPLMGPLTECVYSQIEKDDDEVLSLVNFIRDQLSGDCNIEDWLSHLGDYRALALRSQQNSVEISGTEWTAEQLNSAHNKIVNIITQIIRWGYLQDEGQHGTPTTPVTGIDQHCRFIHALFHTAQAGLHERRGPIRLFTTNYDTLLEDALSLSHVEYWDGFSGGAVAFRTHRYGDYETDRDYRAHLYKLHGSIDWYLGRNEQIYRVRHSDPYPDAGEDESRALIYPQATKYVATQRDPFAAQFDSLRKALNSLRDNVLVICGYSFGDEHINDEIEIALKNPNNKTTVVAFVSARTALPDRLKSWTAAPWGDRVLVITAHGIYAGGDGPFCKRDDSNDWWSFQGVTRLLSNGISGEVQ